MKSPRGIVGLPPPDVSMCTTQGQEKTIHYRPWQNLPEVSMCWAGCGGLGWSFWGMARGQGGPGAGGPVFSTSDDK